MNSILTLKKPSTSFLKSLSWRLVATLTTMVISYCVTRTLSFAIAIGGIEVFAKIALYYFHERFWCRITQ